ncbi:MAG: DUF805 domain-containing protein [Actinomycetota bacterium]
MENIDWVDLLFKFDGRINRGKFWAGAAASWAIAIAMGILFGIAVAINSVVVWAIVVILSIAFYVVMVWMGLAISIKRWHDRGKSGWWVLIGLVPLIGGIWALVETGFLEGDSGPNEYGPDPLAV